MDERLQVLVDLAKWGVTAIIAIFISDYLISQLAIINNLVIILLTSAIISLSVQAVRSHDNDSFKIKWFVFYFLVYAFVIMALEEYILPRSVLSSFILSAVVVGLIISGTIVTIQKIGIRSRTIPWISIVLLCLLVVANLGYLQNLLQINLQIGSQNVSISEGKQSCPTPSTLGLSALASNLNSGGLGASLTALTNKSIWRTEHSFSPCYNGKYQGQYPNWIYCDNMIVSRWETTSSGTISYRWYTAVSAQWKPQNIGSSTYVFAGFSCENGQKVTVTKGVTTYYVYDSRDGSKISIAY